MMNSGRRNFLKAGSTALLVAGSLSVFAGDEPEASKVLERVKKAAEWQMDHRFGYHKLEWYSTPFYMGLSDLSEVSGDPKYIDFVRSIGEKYEWKLWKRPYNADDHAIGLAYLKLYALDRDDACIAKLRERFDWIIANPPPQNYWKKYTPPEREKTKWPGWRSFNKDVWSWCDALYMAPPVWAGLWKETGEQKYLDFMVQEWKQTTDWLWDDEAALYYRDKNYIGRTSPDGAKIFWSRGNGWVFGGLVEVLQYLPADHPQRPYFEGIFKRMAVSVKAIQMENGTWAPSLLDSAHTPQDETSGTAFFVYGMAWGINNGLLDPAQYRPVVLKGWQALCDRQKESGRLINIQPVGARPEGFDPDSTVVYGMGAFISAGCEMYKMVGGETPELKEKK